VSPQEIVLRYDQLLVCASIDFCVCVCARVCVRVCACMHACVCVCVCVYECVQGTYSISGLAAMVLFL